MMEGLKKIPTDHLVVCIKNVKSVCGILLSNKKEEAIDMCNDVNESQNNYAN